MARSIMHSRQDGTCYLCMKLHGIYDRHTNLQEHHVMGGNPGRKLSERYGLKVYLCFQHHTYDGGPEAVHRNDEIRRELEADAQRAFEREHPDLKFREVFGRNALGEPDRQQAQPEQSCSRPAAGIPAGFIPLEEKQFLLETEN